MDILIFSKHFWPESFRINDLASELLARGCNTSVLTSQPNYPQGKIYDGYKPWRFNSECTKFGHIYRVPTYPRKNASLLNLALNYLSFLVVAAVFSPILLRKRNIDIVFVYGTSPLIQGLSAIPLKFFKKAKLVTWVQDLWPEDMVSTGKVNNRGVLKLNRLLARLLYYFSDLVLIQSKGMRPRLEGICAQDKIEYFPNPAEPLVLNRIFETPPSFNQKIFEKKFSILYAGNIGGNQDIQNIVEMADKLQIDSEIQILFVGDGSQRPALEKMIKERKLVNVKWLGAYPIESMPYILEKADALLITLAKRDNLEWTVPGRVQAFMAAGKPIVAAVSGDAARLINESGCGLVCDPGDPELLYGATRQLYAFSSAERERMGQNGRNYAYMNFDIVDLTSKLLFTFSQLMRNRT